MAQKTVCVLMMGLVDPAVRDSGYDDGVFFGNELCDDFAGTWMYAGFEGEEVDCAAFCVC